MTRLLATLAASAPIPVFAVSGAGGREVVQDLRLRPELQLVETPSAANLLLVAGVMPSEFADALAHVHDAMSHPRSTVVLSPDRPGSESTPSWPFAVRTSSGVDPVATISEVHTQVLSGLRPSDPPVLPDTEPAPWRGVGPYGQGGSGMTGGTPYGRPMAELAPDRDGLRLDVLPLRIGPFFPGLPSGLVLDVRFAGDVVVDASVSQNAFGRTFPDGLSASPFVRALSEPVLVAELELARARAHLRWTADALVAHGLPALAARVLRLARRLTPDHGPSVHTFARRLAWTQVMRWSSADVGRIEAAQLHGLGAGPVARAAGVAEDVRTDDPAYLRLGFEPVLHKGGTAAARWRQRLAETLQSLELAARAGDVRTEPRGHIESPRGRLEPGSAPADRLLPLLPDLVTGLEWGDAVAAVVSLDLDLEEAAAMRSPGSHEVAA